MAILSHVALILVLIIGYEWLHALDGAIPRQWLVLGLMFVGCVMAVALVATWLHRIIGPGALGALGSLGVLAMGWIWRQQGRGASAATVSAEMAMAASLVGLVLIEGALTTALSGDLHEARLRSCSLHFHRNFAGALAPSFASWWIARSAAIAYEHLRDRATVFQPSALYAYSHLVTAFEIRTGSLVEAERLAGAALLTQAERVSLTAALHHTADVLLVVSGGMFAASIAMALTGKGRPLSQPSGHAAPGAPMPASQAKPGAFMVR